MGFPGQTLHQVPPESLHGRPAEPPNGTAAQARAMVYFALAEALADPTSELQEMLLSAVTKGAQQLHSPACQQAAVRLASRPMASLETLHHGYARLISSPDRPPLVLYESLHRGGGLSGQIMWEVERHYQALGLAPVRGELPDHASVELAFLGHLASAEAEAGHDRRLATRLRTAQGTFLRTHAGTWLPEVGIALAHATANHHFYVAVGHLLRGFLVEELSGRRPQGAGGVKLPTLTEPRACTLCGLCVGSCPVGALRVIESSTETALRLNSRQCLGCNRCERICPEGVMRLSVAAAPGHRFGTTKKIDERVLRQSPRASCSHCGQPTVSQAELDAILARLQPDPITRERLYMCLECKTCNT